MTEDKMNVGDSRNYEPIQVQGRTHIVCRVPSRVGTQHPDADYRGTGKALCAVMPKGMDFTQWLLNRVQS